MIDREKVIKALEICEKKDCVLCPYTDWCGEYDDSYYDCTKLLAKDALALLKKQEPMEPITDKLRNYVCPVCGDRLRGGKFCMNCGQAVKWNA